MSVRVVTFNQQAGQDCLRKCCRLFSRATSGHAPEIYEATGIRPAYIRAYGSLAAMQRGRYLQPLYLLYRLGQGMVAVMGETGRQHFIEWLAFLAASVGCDVIPRPERSGKTLAQEIAEADQATARARIEQTRRYLDHDGPTAYDVEHVSPLVAEAVRELLESQAAAEAEAVGR